MLIYLPEIVFLITMCHGVLKLFLIRNEDVYVMILNLLFSLLFSDLTNTNTNAGSEINR